MNEQSLSLGRLTRSLAHTLHQDYVNLVMKFKESSASSSHLTEGDDNTRRRELISWAKEKSTIISQFRNLLRVPYDINLYETINMVNAQMFQRRVHVINIVGQMKEMAASLNNLKTPIYAMEEALYFMKEGKKKIDYFKIDYILKGANSNDPEFQVLEKLVKEETTTIPEDQIKITQIGFFENIAFCISNYFDTHHYVGEKVFCHIGDLAEVEMLYNPKQPVKFVIFKIRLLRTLSVFQVGEDGKDIRNRLNRDLNNLARKLNQKIFEEFDPNSKKPVNKVLPDSVRAFETYSDHLESHRQLSKILYYLKHYLRTVVFQAVSLTLQGQMRGEESLFNKTRKIKKLENLTSEGKIIVSTSK